MFIDYLTLIMLNLVAGTVLLVYYLWKGMNEADQRPYASAFAGIGLIALITGLHITLSWPLPGSYNIGFGEPTVLFGVIFLTAALSLSQGWDLFPTTILAFFAGFYALLVGLRILSLGMTQSPSVAAIGFVTSGLAGIFAGPYLKFFRGKKIWLTLAIIVLLVSAAVWAFLFGMSLWGHLEAFAKWIPPTMAAIKP
jgi:putative membrane protein